MNIFLAIFPFLSAAGDADFSEITDTINSLISQMWVPCIAVASTLCVLWGVYLGIKFWMANGDDQKKKSAKGSIIYFVIGIVIIFLVAVGAPMLIAALSEWAQVG